MPTLDDIVWVNKYAVDVRTGKTVWNVDEDDKVKSVVQDRRVFLQYQDGRLECRWLLDGNLQWTADSIDPGEYGDRFWLNELDMTDGTLVRETKKSIRCYESNTGIQLWSFPKSDCWYDGITVVGMEGLVINCDGMVSYVHLASGKTIWAIEDYAYAGVFTLDNELILVSEDSLAKYAIEDGAQCWKFDRTGEPARQAWLAGSKLVSGSGSNSNNPWTACFDVKTGSCLWSVDRQFPVAATLSSDGRSVIVARRNDRARKWDGDGEICAYDSTTWNIKWRYPIHNNGITLLSSDGRLYFAEYCPHSCGSVLRCIGESDGNLIWDGGSTGIRCDSTKYLNHVRLERHGHHIVLIGQECGGDYVETICIESGNRVTVWCCLFGAARLKLRPW